MSSIVFLRNCVAVFDFWISWENAVDKWIHLWRFWMIDCASWNGGCLKGHWPLCEDTERTHLFLLRMLSAWGERMYSSTICFQRRRQSHPRKKLWTFFIFLISSESSGRSSRRREGSPLDSFFKAQSWQV